MIHRVFSVYDSAAEAYLQPFFSPTKATAIRSISAAVADPQHNFSKYAHQYTLFQLGEFDDVKASFSLFPSPASLGVLTEFLPSS